MRLLFVSTKGPRQRLLSVLAGGLFLFLCLGAFAQGDDDSKPTVFRDRVFDAQFTTDSDVWLVGHPGLAMHSPDGGVNWNQVDAGTRNALYSIDFITPDLGWIAGRTGMILHTKDGGKSWVKQKSDTIEPLFAVDFLNEKVGYIVGNFGTVLVTTDGGENWKLKELEIMINASLNAVVVLDENTALVAGDYPSWELEMVEGLKPEQISNIYRTTDGGNTWEVIPTGSTSILFDMTFAADKKTGYAVGSTGEMLATVDAGLTWEKIDTSEKNHLVGVALSGDRVWAVGLDGVIISLEGDKVKQIPSDLYAWLSALAFTKSGKGVIAGGRGALLVTDDGGTTWK